MLKFLWHALGAVIRSSANCSRSCGRSRTCNYVLTNRVRPIAELHVGTWRGRDVPEPWRLVAPAAQHVRRGCRATSGSVCGRRCSERCGGRSRARGGALVGGTRDAAAARRRGQRHPRHAWRAHRDVPPPDEHHLVSPGHARARPPQVLHLGRGRQAGSTSFSTSWTTATARGARSCQS